MFLYPYIFTFCLGAMMGSFLNVVGLRFLREESIVWPGSHCYSCNEKIMPYDNIPVLSWLILGGKCRRCKAGISVQYPVIEFLTGALFLATVLHFGFTLEAGFMLYLIANFVVILITDFREQYIFDINSIGLIPAGLIFSFFNLGGIPGEAVIPFTTIAMPYALASALMAVAGAFVIFLLLNLLSRLMVGKPGFGEGDTRLLMGIGSFFGVKIMVLVFLLSFLIQAAVGLPMLLVQWIRSGAYRTAALLFGGFILAGVPYLAQYVIEDENIILLLAVIFGVIAMICAMKALRSAKDLPSGLTYLPFGPAIVVAALGFMFFREPLLTIFRMVLPV